MKQDQEKQGQVISLVAAGSNSMGEPDQAEEGSTNFLQVMRKNAENQARLRKERAKANRGVIRSYRLK